MDARKRGIVNISRDNIIVPACGFLMDSFLDMLSGEYMIQNGFMKLSRSKRRADEPSPAQDESTASRGNMHSITSILLLLNILGTSLWIRYLLKEIADQRR